MGVSLVLDTCALMSLSGLVEKAVSVSTHQRITDANELVVSPISLYEMGIKWKKGSFILSEDPAIYWERCIDAYDLTPVPIKATVLAKAYSLPDIHRDPFDRIIIAQALLMDLTVVTFDAVFAAYGVQSIC